MSSILFVDDEQNILNSLRRMLHDEPWNLFFAAGGQEGLDILEKEKVDLVISDVKMPEMDGMVFMQKVKELYPHVIRIFMSGHADRDAISNALAAGYAQQILSKPWNEAELRDVIHKALLQAREMNKKKSGLQNIISSLSSLCIMPQTYIEIKKCFSHINTVSNESLAEIIEQDTAVSAEMLRWANSAFFGQRYKVETVERALMVLGIDIVEGLVISHSVFRSLSPDPQSTRGFDLRGFQTHSLSCGILSKLLISRLDHADPKDADRAFTAGLLHDVGKLVEERYLTDMFNAAVDMSHKKNIPLLNAEHQVMDTTHEEIGRYLAEWWGMPSFLVDAISWHHAPKMLKPLQPVVHAVHVANALVQQFGIGASGNSLIPEADKTSLELFEISKEDLPSIKDEVIHYLQ